MRPRQDIDRILRDWPYQPGEVNARLAYAEDGREVLQMRIELGLLQMETTHRPDGERPGGEATYLDFLLRESASRGERFELSEAECAEVDREFLQFYHRRICWLAVQRFDLAIRDADHTLHLMDFVHEHSPIPQWTLSHEQYRPFVLFHRTQAAALAGLDVAGPEKAIEEIQQGLERIENAFQRAGGEDPLDEDQMTGQLSRLLDWIRQHYRVRRTLSERLADAVAAEEYELAARLRDEIARQRPRSP